MCSGRAGDPDPGRTGRTGRTSCTSRADGPLRASWPHRTNDTAWPGRASGTDGPSGTGRPRGTLHNGGACRGKRRRREDTEC